MKDAAAAAIPAAIAPRARRLPRIRLRTGGQRLLARGHRLRRGLRPSRPGRSRDRRHRGASAGPASSSASRTHSHEELERALREEPDYVALGPIYETKLKVMPWAPQGLAAHRRMEGARQTPARRHRRHHLGARAARYSRQGLQSVAVVTDIVMSDDPEQRTRDWIAGHRAVAKLVHSHSTGLTPQAGGLTGTAPPVNIAPSCAQGAEDFDGL